MTSKKYTLFETFVGAGGSHIGFKQAGFVSIYVNDNEQSCLDTLILNNPELKETAFLDNSSILDIDSKKLFKKLNYSKGEIDVFFGGIVCKGFSLAGERSPNDERNYFYHKQLDLVKCFMPKISVIENVPGIRNAKVLSKNTPKDIRGNVDKIWQDIENYKGEKANLRKLNQVTEEVEKKGLELRRKKTELLKELELKGYLINVLDDIRTIYDEFGYNVSYEVLNTAWYGASTKRERVVIVATRKDLKGDFCFPTPIYNSEEIKTKLFNRDHNNFIFKKPITINDALKKIDYSNKNDFDNQPMNHNEKTVRRFKYIPAGDNISNHIDKIPEDLKISKFYSRGNTMRLSGDKLSPTLVPGHSNFPVHPREHRSITVREAAIITGFPIDYKFIGSHTKRCEHVGNAVPPPLAKAIAESCKTFLDEQ
jgi:DNA (cytosine-5)-methyltransferase 1